jgi:hypothetical protein
VSVSQITLGHPLEVFFTGRPDECFERSGAEGIEQLRLAFEREQQEIDHAERVEVRPQAGPPPGIPQDRHPAAFHRPMEHLGDDAPAHPGQTAVVQLRLAQDVEPERRVGDQRVPLLGREIGRTAPPLPFICSPVSGVTPMNRSRAGERP